MLRRAGLSPCTTVIVSAPASRSSHRPPEFVESKGLFSLVHPLGYDVEVVLVSELPYPRPETEAAEKNEGFPRSDTFPFFEVFPYAVSLGLFDVCHNVFVFWIVIDFIFSISCHLFSFLRDFLVPEEQLLGFEKKAA